MRLNEDVVAEVIRLRIGLHQVDVNAEIGVPLPARLGELLEILHPAGTVGDVAAVVGVCVVVALGLVALAGRARRSPKRCA